MRTGWRGAVLALLVLGWAPVAMASRGDSRCVPLYDKGDFARAHTVCERDAGHGDPGAQFILGRMFEQGEGVKRDERRALAWYLKAARQGYDFAQYYVGHMYYEGLGTKQDYHQAYLWTLKAAHQGFVPAYYNLGLQYQYGDGVKRNPAQAVSWYRKAASAGDSMGQLAYAACYLQGIGVKRDLATGYAWLRLAAHRGSAEARQHLLAVRGTLSQAQRRRAADYFKELQKRFPAPASGG